MFKTELNNYHSAVIVETANANINTSKEEQIDTPAVEGAISVNTEERSIIRTPSIENSHKSHLPTFERPN